MGTPDYDRVAMLAERSILQLPIDELGLEVLRDFDRTSQWNDYNYVNEAQNAGYGKPTLDALSEAIGWLRACGLVTPDLSQHSSNAAFVTRFGAEAARRGAGPPARDRGPSGRRPSPYRE
jgi:hypothetical protein